MTEGADRDRDPFGGIPRPRWIDIADQGPDLGEEEWGDEKVPILDEPPFLTQIRNMDGGPYYVTADSGVQVPTDFFANIDEGAVRRAVEVANKQPPEGVTPDGKATIPPEQRTLLERGGPAGKALLAAIDRGLDASTPELEEASQERLRKAGLL